MNLVERFQLLLALIVGLGTASGVISLLNQAKPDVGGAVCLGLLSIGSFICYAALKVSLAIKERNKG